MTIHPRSTKLGTIIRLILLVSLCMTFPALSAKEETGAGDRAKTIAAAREIMQAQQYCALITLDEQGLPQARTMNPFPPDEGMVVYFATNTRSRKVQHIRKNPHVSIYYADHKSGSGYVCLSGTAILIDDMQEILRHKRAYWDQAFEPGLKNLVLIKVIPERIDVLNYKSGIAQDTATWRAPSLEMNQPQPQK